MQAWYFLCSYFVKISLEFFIDQNEFKLEFWKVLSHYRLTCSLTLIKDEVKSVEIRVVVHELELAIQRAL